MDLVSVSCRQPLFPATFVEETVFSPSYIFGTFVKNKVGTVVWIHDMSFLLSLMFCLQQNQRARGQNRFYPEAGGRGSGQTMYTHVSKCNFKIFLNARIFKGIHQIKTNNI
jgi:hypothetical protein